MRTLDLRRWRVKLEVTRGKLSVADRARTINRFLTEQHLYPLLLSSLLASGLWIGRMIVYHSWTYVFLNWNLFLAWVPYLWGLWAASIHQRFPRRWGSLLIPGTLWLLFFPNAPYIITDFLHLRERAPIPVWYDTGLLAAFAFAGIFLAVASLNTMHEIVKDFIGAKLSWLFVTVVAGLTGFGIYLGRFLNLNSWDVFVYPQQVLSDILHRLVHPFSNLQAYGVTIVFAAFMFVCYWMFRSMRQRERA